MFFFILTKSKQRKQKQTSKQQQKHFKIHQCTSRSLQSGSILYIICYPSTIGKNVQNYSCFCCFFHFLESLDTKFTCMNSRTSTIMENTCTWVCSQVAYSYVNELACVDYFRKSLFATSIFRSSIRSDCDRACKRRSTISNNSPK